MTIHDVRALLQTAIDDEIRLDEDYHRGRVSALKLALELISEVSATDPVGIRHLPDHKLLVVMALARRELDTRQWNGTTNSQEAAL